MQRVALSRRGTTPRGARLTYIGGSGQRRGGWVMSPRATHVFSAGMASRITLAQQTSDLLAWRAPLLLRSVGASPSLGYRLASTDGALVSSRRRAAFLLQLHPLLQRCAPVIINRE
jgi:hypothetical protein